MKIVTDRYLFWNCSDWMGRSIMWKENRALAKLICTSSDFKFFNFLSNWFFYLKCQFKISPNTVQDDCLIIKYHSTKFFIYQSWSKITLSENVRVLDLNQRHSSITRYLRMIRLEILWGLVYYPIIKVFYYIINYFLRYIFTIF